MLTNWRRDPRSLRVSRKKTIGLALVATIVRALPAWAGAVSIPRQRQAHLPPASAILVLADFVLSVDDNPTCDTDAFTFACNDPIPGCTATAGSMSVVSVQISGRQHPGPRPPFELGQHGGRPFSVARSFSGCFPLGGYSARASLDDHTRLTESVLLDLMADDLRYQPFPDTVAAALLREFHLSSGIPVISSVIGPLEF